jgi:predicted PurR-regulated permease PerM
MAAITQQGDPPPPGEVPSARGWPVSLTTRSIWTTLAIVGGALLTFLIASKALDALLVIFVAIVLAEGIRPLVEGMSTAHIPRLLGVLIVYLVGGGVLAGLILLLLQPVASEAVAFANALPTYGTQLQQFGNQVQQTIAASPNLQHALTDLEGQAASQAANGLSALVAVPFTVLEILLSVVVVLTLALLWLSASEKLTPFVLSLLPADMEYYARTTIGQLSAQLGGYVRGVIVNMLIIGVLTGFGLFLLGVPYAALLGVVAGLIEALPIVGPWISGIIALAVALLTAGPLKGFEVIAFFIVLQQLEGNTLVPLVMSRTTRTHPFVVLVALVMGEALLGIVGAVLAVPAAIVVQVLVVRVIAPLARAACGRPNPWIER